MISALLGILSVCSIVSARLATEAAKRCIGTISSLDDVSDAVSCTTVNIDSFTVPADGDVAFGNMTWAGPLFEISVYLFIQFSVNGNGYIFDGGGPFYWDGLGSNGGLEKPRPMMKIKISGIFENTKVVNSPAQTFSVSNPGPLTITGITIDNSQGDFPNNQSNGLPAGHNTDGFDCSTTDLVIENSSIQNQDDCLAINKGSNIVFQNNTCSGGHGISVGSISSNVTVAGIIIADNTQALRIKMDVTSTNSTVTNITYSGNVGTNLTEFGILIDQSYPNTLATPGTGVILSDVNFIGATNTLSVEPSATPIAINCGQGACIGKGQLEHGTGPL
ncbi:hypothetical protein Clacol_008883 [Clathrus columnatus]|uniref:endo-polygalacturonase n=1 Tax=Clathrus columnatus TaxID=1419009 RepID=A0AAV5ALH7_9AGAM|nr:hypothetical protein Clacol_008883 [Clathrus columnatus]